MRNARQISTIFHLADECNWESIKNSGLKPTAQLMAEANEDHLINQHRSDEIILKSGILIRDQKPIPPSSLRRCLTANLTPKDWYRLLNQRVFFWIDIERLKRQLNACKSPQYLMTIDAKKLLLNYGAIAEVTPFNVGNARRAAAVRGLSTFVPYSRWVQSAWQSEIKESSLKIRSACHRPVELTILGPISNIFDFVIATTKLDSLRGL